MNSQRFWARQIFARSWCEFTLALSSSTTDMNSAMIDGKEEVIANVDVLVHPEIEALDHLVARAR